MWLIELAAAVVLFYLLGGWAIPLIIGWFIVVLIVRLSMDD